LDTPSYVVLCHRGTARPRVVDEGDGFQIRTVVANVLNTQSRTAEKGCSSSLDIGHGLILLLTKCNTGPRILRALVNTVTNLQVP
jgi:hypothetical protein